MLRLVTDIRLCEKTVIYSLNETPMCVYSAYPALDAAVTGVRVHARVRFFLFRNSRVASGWAWIRQFCTVTANNDVSEWLPPALNWLLIPVSDEYGWCFSGIVSLFLRPWCAYQRAAQETVDVNMYTKTVEFPLVRDRSFVIIPSIDACGTLSLAYTRSGLELLLHC